MERASRPKRRTRGPAGATAERTPRRRPNRGIPGKFLTSHQETTWDLSCRVNLFRKLSFLPSFLWKEGPLPQILIIALATQSLWLLIRVISPLIVKQKWC